MIERISHIGIVVEDVAKAQKLWIEVFGFKKFDEFRVEAEGIHSVFLSVGGTPKEMTIELMEPLDKADMSNAVARRLAKAGEGFYHLAVDVADVEETATSLEAEGLPIIRRPAIGAEHGPRWLVHPKAANGVMVEGLEASTGLAAGD
jgi:methylmalonyl-CoA epimerase